MWATPVVGSWKAGRGCDGSSDVHVSRSKGRGGLSCQCAIQQTDEEQDEEDEEEDPGDGGGLTSEASESEEPSDQGEDKKSKCPAKHENSPYRGDIEGSPTL